MWTKFFGTAAEEDFNYSAWMWFQITVIAVVITFLFFLCGGAAVIMQPGPLAQQQVAQAFAPFFLGAAGIVTFCGAVWRGKLNSEQIKQQIRQNNAKDEENLAKLLIDGGKLVGAEDTNNIRAGIAALQAVVTSPVRGFAPPAMDMLADLVRKTNINTEFEIYRSSVRAINAGAENGNRASTALSLKSDAANESLWLAINGTPAVLYTEGSFDQEEFKKLDWRSSQFRFAEVTFSRCTIDTAVAHFRKCAFEHCHIKFATKGVFYGKITACNLSGLRTAATNAKQIALAIRGTQCWYYEEDPPQTIEGIDWSFLCEVRQRDEH